MTAEDQQEQAALTAERMPPAGAGVARSGTRLRPPSPAWDGDSLSELRLARLTSFRQPSVAELEEMEWLREHVRRRNGQVA